MSGTSPGRSSLSGQLALVMVALALLSASAAMATAQQTGPNTDNTVTRIQVHASGDAVVDRSDPDTVGF